MTGDQPTPEQIDAKLRARVRAQVAESRRRQGLPPTVTDPDFLRDLAGEVADGLAQRVTRKRQAQGLPPHVEDDGLLDRVAGWLAGVEDEDTPPQR